MLQSQEDDSNGMALSWNEGLNSQFADEVERLKNYFNSDYELID